MAKQEEPLNQEEIKNEAVTLDPEGDDAERPEWDDEKWLSKEDESDTTPDTEVSTIEADPEDVAVDEIVKKEADEIIAADDKRVAEAFDDKNWLQRFKAGAASVWANPKQRYGAMAGVTSLVLLLLVIPTTRFELLNTVGVRATANIVVLDQETQTPLKNVQVTIGSSESQTSIDGVATFSDVRLGSQTMTITKSAYDEYTTNVTISTGTNQIDRVALLPIGTQFAFTAQDWLSEQPLTDVEVSYQDSSAVANEDGELLLTIPPTDDTEIDVTFTADGYKNYIYPVNTLNTEVREVGMVVETAHYFVSKRDGRYDVYKVDADGANEQLIVQGTGKEQGDIRFTVSPSGNKAILVATRDGVVDDDNFKLHGVYLIDLEDSSINKIDESQRVDLAGWIDDSIIYVKIQSGASGRNPERHRLVGYNVETEVASEIAASNYFNDLLVTDSYVFYAPSDAYKENPEPYLFQSNQDGSVKQRVVEQEVWTVLRDDYDSIVFYDTQQDWFQSDIDDLFANKLESDPIDRTSRIYTTSPDGSKSLWIDQRDGKGVLLLTDTQSGDESIIWRQGGLRNPVHWLSDSHVVFRVVDGTETADYVVNVDGGDPVKILDVSDVSGFDRYYYYY